MPSPASFIRTLQLADPTPDGELLRRFVHGDRDAFELIVWRHSAMVLRLCKSMLRDHHRAEDATQATFLILARKVKTIGDGQTLAAWLHRVAVRVAMRAGSDNRLSLTLEKQPEPSFTASNDVEQREQERLLHEEVDRLNEKYRLPVLLCFFEGLTHAEAAKRLNWPIGTVAGRLSRAKKLLVKRLTDRGVSVGIVTLFAALTVNRLSAVAPSLVAAILKLQRGDAVPATVLYLMNGGLQMMLWTKVKMGLAIMMLCGSVALTTAWAVGTTQQPAETKETHAAKPKAEETPKAVAAANPLEDFKPDWQSLEDDSMYKLHNLMRIMQESPGDKYPTDILDKNGKALLSWRVALLPALGDSGKSLYDKFRLDEPWNSKHNRALIPLMPVDYRISLQLDDAVTTYFKVIVDPGTPFAYERTAGKPEGQFASNTYMGELQPPIGTNQIGLQYVWTLGIVQAGEASIWTKPDSLLLSKVNITNELKPPFASLIRTVSLKVETVYVDPSIPIDLFRQWSMFTIKADNTDWIKESQVHKYFVHGFELDKSLKRLNDLREYELTRRENLLQLEQKQGLKSIEHKYKRVARLEELIALLRKQNKQIRLELGMTD